MADPEAGTELFASYEAELKLVRAELSQKLDQIADLTGEPRKAAIRLAERSLEEASELLSQLRIEKQSIPSAARAPANARFRNHETDIDSARRTLRNLSRSDDGDRERLFGGRYTDDPDATLEQRQQLLSGTERLDRSSKRLRDSARVAEETEQIGRGTLADLQVQREQIVHTRGLVLESEGYVDRSVKTLRGMARRMATNRVITVAIITVLVLLILGVIWSKFR